MSFPARQPGRRPARRLARRAAGVLIGLCLWAGPWSAPASAGPDLGSVVARLPTSVDLALAVDNGAALRRELGTMPLMLTLASQPRPEAVFEAWSELAGALGMTDTEAFDLLLGQRMILAGSELQYGDRGGSRWALLSEIDPSTERTLREKLGAVPRRIVNGQVVLEFEHGSFLMATSSGRLRCAASGAFESTPASALLLLAPAEDRLFFEQLLPLLHCDTPEHPLADLPVGRAVASMRTRDAVFLSRLPDADRDPERYVAANVGIVDGSWRIDATLAPAESWVPGVDRDAPATWSPRLLETLPPDPALVMIGTRSAVREARLWAMPLVGLPLPDPESAGLGTLLGERSMFAVWLNDQTAEDAQPEVLMASDTPNLDRLVKPADGFLASQAAGAGNASVRQEVAGDGRERDLSAVRSITLRAGAEAPVIDATLNWLFVPEDGGVPTAGASRPASAAQPGWWVLHYQPHRTTTAAPSRASASVFADLTPRRYLHVGRAEPRLWGERAAALDAVTPTGEPAQFLTSPFVLPQIWSIRWAVWYDEGARAISADVTVELTAPNTPAK